TLDEIQMIAYLAFSKHKRISRVVPVWCESYEGLIGESSEMLGFRSSSHDRYHDL
ncbi:hypothetical protein HAX54_014376, partial [Datura stramonium]|nr:hypothetical protein [Datura stramonium]